MSRYSILHAIEHLDPEKDHQRIVFLSTATIFRSIRPAHWSLPSFVPFVSRAYRAILLRESNFSNSSVITVLRYGHLIIFFSVGVLAYSFESFAQANQSVKNF